MSFPLSEPQYPLALLFCPNEVKTALVNVTMLIPQFEKYFTLTELFSKDEDALSDSPLVGPMAGLDSWPLHKALSMKDTVPG